MTIINQQFLTAVQHVERDIDLTFCDAPFNERDKTMQCSSQYDVSMAVPKYWEWLQEVVSEIKSLTTNGGSMYFLQTDSNIAESISILENVGWNVKNTIIWHTNPRTDAESDCYQRSYHVLVYCVNGTEANTFNRLRKSSGSHCSDDARFLTDVWNDIDPLNSVNTNDSDEERIAGEAGSKHSAQTPKELVARLILSSTVPGNTVLSPFAGTGTTGVIASQLDREYVLIERDSTLIDTIKKRLRINRSGDDIYTLREDYSETSSIDKIWDAA